MNFWAVLTNSAGAGTMWIEELTDAVSASAVANSWGVLFAVACGFIGIPLSVEFDCFFFTNDFNVTARN